MLTGNVTEMSTNSQKLIGKRSVTWTGLSKTIQT